MHFIRTVILRPEILIVLTASTLLGACASAQDVPAPESAAAQFDWFRYEGSDAIYERVKADADEYLNPILAGFYPDPSITRAGDDYYLVTSSFSYFPGVPLFHSNDLVHWRQLGHVLDRPSQLDLDSLAISEGVFAPTIRYHDGTFYVVTTLVGSGGNILVTADDPAGPWSDPVYLPFDGIDPSIFFDDDGRVYITNNGPPPEEPRYEGHRALWMQEYDPKAQEMIGPRKVIVNGGVDISEEPIWIEAPHLFKINGSYYLIAAEGGTGPQHSEVVFKSDGVWGPYEPYAGNPILTQRHLPDDRPHPVSHAGHADFVQLPNGNWWTVFLGVRPYENGYFNTGRETFLLPVRWQDDWPVILDSTETVPYVHERPELPKQPSAGVPKNGNFTIRDDFDGSELAPYWHFIRGPGTDWHDTDNGTLTIQARSAPLDERTHQPSFVGRRQQHARATATTALHYLPQGPGDKAGLAAFQNHDYFYLLAVTLREGEPIIQLEKTEDGETSVIASAPVDLNPGEPLYLKIEARGAEYDFAYGSSPDDWTLLQENADGTILSTLVAGGFVGAYLGLYAYAE